MSRLGLFPWLGKLNSMKLYRHILQGIDFDFDHGGDNWNVQWTCVSGNMSVSLGTMLAFPIASFLFEDAVYCSTLKSSFDLPFHSENYVPTYLYTLALPPVVNSSTDF